MKDKRKLPEGMRLPKRASTVKVSSKAKNKVRREILDFARDNKLLIHPGRGFDYYVDNFFKFNSCVCDRSRLRCPCPEAIKECEEDGWCKCRLYWRDHDTFKDKIFGEEEP